jgi:DNA-binding transcriptional ArsR family regulator
MVDARTFQALSDPTRLKILSLLGGGSMNVTAMVEKLDVTQPAVSRHLKVLREAGLIVDARNGKWVEYSSNPPAVAEAAEYLKRLYHARGEAHEKARGDARREAAAVRSPKAESAQAYVRMPRAGRRRAQPRPKTQAGAGPAAAPVRAKRPGPETPGKQSARAGVAKRAVSAEPAEPAEHAGSRYVVERDEDFIDDLML